MASLASATRVAAWYLVFLLLSANVTSLGASTDTHTWGGDYLRNGYQPYTLP
jgi:hypothetical protein